MAIPDYSSQSIAFKNCTIFSRQYNVFVLITSKQSVTSRKLDRLILLVKLGLP
jgi:hypothetical protein